MEPAFEDGGSPCPEHENTAMLTADKLSELGFREEVIRLFERDFPAGIDISDWTLDRQMAMLQSPVWRRYWGLAVEHGIIPAWSMRCANLEGADLKEADLRGADLSQGSQAQLIRPSLVSP
jgi:uncharacterized protein YjbI with pentapeptide repeats